MILSDLQLNRSLQKDPNQTEATKDPIFTAANPAPKTGNTFGAQLVRGNENDDGSKNILTGTVITSCFIQTSALPSRVELFGNDITFFDNTFTEQGNSYTGTNVVKGDTSRIIFTHDLNSNEGFIIEKRASIFDTYDNVLSIYANPARTGNNNYLFIGRNGDANDPKRNIACEVFAIDQDTSLDAPSGTVPSPEAINGIYKIEFSQDGVSEGGDILMYSGSSKTIWQGTSRGDGMTSMIGCSDNGLTGLAYKVPGGLNLVFYLDSATGKVTTEVPILPVSTGTINLGSPSLKFGTYYGSVSACPLPTVDNALDVLDAIEEPTLVGDRGHYGDGKYFDDLTFPEELLWTNSDGHKDIEHNHMIGFLLKAVKELKNEVDTLKSRLP